MEQPKQKHPLVAVALAMLLTGLGHLYLRRWSRALGWVLLAYGSTLFVDEMPTWNQMLAGNFDPLALWPVLCVGFLSIVDAYVLARAQNRASQAAAAAQAPSSADGRTDARTVRCPNCGRELDSDLDSDLDFCHWCSAELPSGASDADTDTGVR